MSGIVTWFAVAMLGGLGAVVRTLVDERIRGLVEARNGGFGRPVRAGHAGVQAAGHRRIGFPAGILVVNVTGSFAAGLLVGAALGDTAALLAATAFVGAYSTFSTWMLDVAQTAAARLWLIAAANLVGSLVLGGLAAAAGLAVGRAL